MGFGEMLLRILSAIAALALVLFLAWLVLRWINKRVPGMGGGASGRMITVLDRISVGKNSYIVLLRVQDKVLLVGISDHAVEKLYELDDPEGKMKLSERPEAPSFTDAMKDAAAKMGFGGKGRGDRQ